MVAVRESVVDEFVANGMAVTVAANFNAAVDPAIVESPASVGTGHLMLKELFNR